MRFLVQNNAGIANKYIRFAKWKVLKLTRRFKEVIYTEIYVKQIAQNQKLYEVVVKMGVPGPDIILSSRSGDLNVLWSDLSAKMKRQLRKKNARK